jgi:purine-cytosine permease-like protein
VIHNCHPEQGSEIRLTNTTFSGMWVSAVLVEHLYFRKGDFGCYDLRYWNAPSQLPLGAAALGASFLSLCLVIPSMNQAWYTGPIARKTGDLGLEAALIITALLYIPLRHVEKGWKGV